MPLSPAGWIIVMVSSPAIPKKTIRQLQLIQNAAARILTRTRKSEHITPVLRSLHWLPVTFRIDFKVLLLVYKSLNGLGPKYIADMLTEYKPNRPLRSLGLSQLEIPRVHTKQGESTFSYYAARSWNQLPEEIKCAKTLATFKSSLKTYLFIFMHLADAFIQSDLQCIQVIHFFCQYMCSLGIEPTTFALLTQCSNH